MYSFMKEVIKNYYNYRFISINIAVSLYRFIYNDVVGSRYMIEHI